MFGETVNNIIGRTVNPYNRLLACGGSSGGEGALLALHGSSVGVGTDLAGSIRIPASSSNLWNYQLFFERIFGFDGVIMPHPRILRGIQQVVTALRKVDHTVVECGEPVIPNFKKDYELNVPVIDLGSLWNLHSEKYKYQKEYLTVWQQQSHIDAWILPVASCSAVKHDDFKYFGYTGVINLLDWPATTISVTFADKDKDIKNMQYKSMSDLDKETYKAYDSDIYDGEPVGIQLVGKRFQEEYLLGLAEQIGEALVA
ncbi:unnamed protein product [Rotaria sp. Silwood1]|nr:unnamed protein product [Rotaria sp. Silwood1]CAF4618608.1 unnamed protein product [Rotaria sp. Silwood1]CAF4638453.1 unnamed protein product [Rotaria sp. Silwood1]